ncbi:MAG TPA: DUF5686 family protein, partial [Cytophagales bacterium]|nr:DUF5686 family protein [Cytophagales bacterium]
NTLVKGKITEVSSNDAIPFANIYFKGTDIAVQSDFEGLYTISSDLATDSLVCMSDGYATRTKYITKGDTQVVDFQLDLAVTELATVFITSGEDPAYGMIRKALKQKDKNNKKTLNAYEYENYSKIEIDINNLSEKLKKRRAFKQIGTFMDSLKKIVGEDGQPVLPVYISETISRVYYKNDLPKQTEKILASHIRGIGVQDGSLISQLIGSSFVEYNFYNNYVSILNKEVPSPLTDNWKVYYKFVLLDSMFIDSEWCYKIDVSPKNKQDMAFKGNIWLADSTWAIKRADLAIGKEANINFVDKIKIQQESQRSDIGPYIPIKGRVVVDVSELADSAAGMIAKYYYSSKDLIFNKPQDDSFYKNPVTLDEKALFHTNEYWLTHRHDTLSETERNVYQMVDSLKKLPVVKTYTEIIDIAINGHKKIGIFDFGPYLFLYANNWVEGSRFRLGFKTNTGFSRKVVVNGFLAYGTKDEKLKYGIGTKYIFSRKNWTEGSVNYSYDLNQLAFFNNDTDERGLFSAFTRWGRQRRPFYSNQLRLNLSSEIFSGLTPSISLKMRDFSPIQSMFKYAHFNNINDTLNGGISSNFANAELSLSVRYAYREIMLQNDNDRISLGTNRQVPILTLGYTQGLKGMYTPFGNSAFDYGKISFRIQQNFNLSFLGTSSFDINAVRYLNYLPYALLTVHPGNETIFTRAQSFNLMNFFEFVSDKYVTVHYMHNFNGFFMNRIPLLKKLKLREFIGFDAVKGHVSPENHRYIPGAFRIMEDGRPDYQGLGSIPYIEVKYGIENILKFIRIDVIHRLTYKDVNYKIFNFGVKFSGQFKI